ncbi:hypothetical protein [Streptomyces yaizuensis]|uniref:DUF317 domain-containing protein n=1 Tax=Streptomyces yaizuensis TaxID=2989713 RepID=A0ABQ5NYN2_9ACTN|nr:hypothetical protein [Streptomyces sp. YSPA8]GLF95332.1 hypothetical protein SYYSPA8_13565 [Streptomyces sp. YSPA8]
MTEKRAWTYDGTELAWLKGRLGRLGRREPGPGHVVSELVPDGYEAYVRIFHRFEATDGSGRSRSWQARAADSAVPFHPELSHWWLRDEAPDSSGRSLWQAPDGALDDSSRSALTRVLAGTCGDRPVCFAYDLAALLWGQDGPLVRCAPLTGLESVREELKEAVGESGPEFWWPQDHSWVVTSDHDLLSTYVGCSAETAGLLLRDDALETLLVTPHTRVDRETVRPQDQ